MVDRSGRVQQLVSHSGLDPTQSDDPRGQLARFLEELVPAETARPAAATVGLPWYGEVSRITAMQDAVVADQLGPMARACNDVEVAHIGAFAGADGVLCLAGTGSMAWAKGPRGSSRVGGFGDLIGDEGSAFWIGQRALGILSAEADGRRQPSPFGEALAAALGIGGAGLIDWAYSLPNPRAGVASVARHLSDLASQGLAEAREILVAAGGELAMLAHAAARTAGLPANAPLACAGSVLNNNIVRGELARRYGAAPAEGILQPVGGAALDAATRAGWSVDADWTSTLRASLEEALGSTAAHQRQLLKEDV
jgi:N-acetylglucosamine kinase-like BadF-type ATPase